jgi:hypothetical protein
MSFLRGRDCLFSTGELTDAFALVVETPTARRAVFDWLSMFGYAARGSCVIAPAGGWQDYGLPYRKWQIDESVAERYLTGLQGQAVAASLSDSEAAMLIRYTEMHHVLVALASESAARRFVESGIKIETLPVTAEEITRFIGNIRRGMYEDPARSG